MARWLRFTWKAVAAVAGLALVGVSFGIRRDREIRLELDAAVEATARAASPTPAAPLDAPGLPVPVARYLDLATNRSHTKIRLTRFDQRGELRTDLASSRWLPFRATQTVAVADPAFVWDARVQIAPFVHVRVRDAFVNGDGLGSVRLVSALPVSEERGGQLNEGELYRFLAEAPLYPSALAPSDRLRWTALDDRRAVATLTHRAMTIAVEFRFDDSGEVKAIYAANRARKAGTEFIPTAWEGHWTRYAERGGLRVPTEGEVGWWIDGTWQPVWRGTILSQTFLPW